MRGYFKQRVELLGKGKLIVRVDFSETLIADSVERKVDDAVVLAIFDNTAGFCAWSILDGHHRVSTVSLRTEYFGTIPCDSLVFQAKVVNRTGHLIRVDVDCWDSSQTNKLASGAAICNSFYSKAHFESLIDSFSGTKT